MKLYAVAFLVAVETRERDGRHGEEHFLLSPGVVVADDEAEALEMAEQRSEDDHPADEGWEHRVCVVEVPDDMLREYARAKWPT